MYYRVCDGTCQQNVNNRSGMDRQYNIWICVPFNNVNQKVILAPMILSQYIKRMDCTIEYYFDTLNVYYCICVLTA